MESGKTGSQINKQVDLSNKKVNFKKITTDNGGFFKNSYGILGNFRKDKATKMKVTFK